MPAACSNLRFGDDTMGVVDDHSGKEQYTRKFIDNVNSVLRLYTGTMVEELEIQIEMDNMLLGHLNMVSSLTKSLSLDLDLVPMFRLENCDLYMFPFELLDSESISPYTDQLRMFTASRPPSQFSGFPSLRKLDLHFIGTTTKDLQDMLSNCCNLEWLRIAKCPLDDELKVDRPLPHLLHLEILYCRITKTNFYAMKLSTFVYKGLWLPIDLSHSSELKTPAIGALLNVFPNVQNMTLNFFGLEAPYVLDNPCRFSRLKHLQLHLVIYHNDFGKIISLITLMGAAPFLQKLEVHFGSYGLWPFVNKPMNLRSLPNCQYDHLKDVLVTGYKGAIARMGNIIMCEHKRLVYTHTKPSCRKESANVRLEDLPKDVLCTILSKLPPKEVVRTSILSSKWKNIPAVCHKLRFEGVTMVGNNQCGKKECTRKFIDNVNNALRIHCGNMVEVLEVKVEFDHQLVDHLNNWVSFAVSSRHIQLSFVSLRLPSQFRGFPNLRKLDIHYIDTSAKDLHYMLSNCCNLEWLRIARCHLDDELKVDCPLPHLLHLEVLHCRITKIKFCAMKLSSFVYKGQWLPIELSHSSELKNVYVCFMQAIFQHAVSGLLNICPNVQNMRLHFCSVKDQLVLDNSCRFSRLKHLQFGGSALWPFGNKPIILRSLPRCQHSHLKDVLVTGYKGAIGQLEFLVHIVEHTPGLELLTIDTAEKVRNLRDDSLQNESNRGRTPLSPPSADRHRPSYSVARGEAASHGLLLSHGHPPRHSAGDGAAFFLCRARAVEHAGKPSPIDLWRGEKERERLPDRGLVSCFEASLDGPVVWFLAPNNPPHSQDIAAPLSVVQNVTTKKALSQERAEFFESLCDPEISTPLAIATDTDMSDYSSSDGTSKRHAAKVYTIAAYNVFMEVSKATAYIISGVVPNKLYRATHANSEERELWCRSTYVVEIDSTSQKYSCECGLYGHFGIPCCHAISVMLHLGVRCIPQSNLMLRWTKQARYFVPQSLANYTDAGGIAQAEVFRRNVLQTTANELVKMGDANNEAFQILLRYMGDAKKEISKILADKAVAGKVPSDNSEITGQAFQILRLDIIVMLQAGNPDSLA
uniref:SWIM-type domain-containing protein n=1 Tax=Leersia perrieri TaxID=77586 RepID=A0A0D9VUE0_9ORYZ